MINVQNSRKANSYMLKDVEPSSHGQNMWKLNLNVSLIPCRRPVKRQTFNWNIQPLDICLYCLWSFYHQYFPKKMIMGQRAEMAEKPPSQANASLGDTTTLWCTLQQ
ncbi:hypothetical protein NQ317_004329 [Molorchus minor]|uniref:Uncharacterized protein n=1 Tax=Molorchus minor TaxID=1323400 RepID=A0ABQ9JZ59_9CUCU|nr:hypothetical protein NQ317_004329 [Molorchus minor]